MTMKTSVSYVNRTGCCTMLWFESKQTHKDPVPDFKFRPTKKCKFKNHSHPQTTWSRPCAAIGRGKIYLCLWPTKWYCKIATQLTLFPHAWKYTLRIYNALSQSRVTRKLLARERLPHISAGAAGIHVFLKENVAAPLGITSHCRRENKCLLPQ